MFSVVILIRLSLKKLLNMEKDLSTSMGATEQIPFQ